MYRMIRLLVLATLAASCASVAPKFTDLDLQRANTQASRIALYERIQSELENSGSSSSNAEYRRLLTNLGQQLADNTAAEIRQGLDSARLGSGLVPFNRLSAAQQDAGQIQAWSQSQYDDLVAEIQQIWSQSEQGLVQEQLALERLDPRSDALARVGVFERIRDLYGNDPTAEQNYLNAKKSAAAILAKNGEQALANGNATAALSRYESLRDLDPAYPNIDALIGAARSALRASEFSDLLLSGDTDRAYAMFLEISARDLPAEAMRDFLTPASLLAEYFETNADNSLKNDQYAEAYRLLRQSVAVKEWIKAADRFNSPAIRNFADAMFNLSAASGARDLAGLEFGYLLLVEEFMPEYESLERLRREASDSIYDGAVRWVSTVSLDSSNEEHANIGKRIGAQVNRYLLDNIPDDVRLVEREYLGAIERERTLDEESADLGAQNGELHAADFLIQGSILEARVDVEIKEGSKRMRVVTGQQMVPNPAFAAFVEDKGSRRQNDPGAPPRTIAQDIEEDISVNVELHRKSGFVGATYRVVDAKSAKVIHTNSVTRSSEHSDEATEGVELGDFQQEFKLASLPPDMEIYGDLASQVALAMGADLVNILANPDGSYFLQCQALADEGEYLAAAELCANAAVLLEFKEQDVAAILPLLKAVTLDSGMRSD